MEDVIIHSFYDKDKKVKVQSGARTEGRGLLAQHLNKYTLTISSIY